MPTAMQMSTNPRHLKIKLTPVFPPIPSRDYDWGATFEGYDGGDLIGHGATKLEAIKMLLEMSEHDADPVTFSDGYGDAMQGLQAQSGGKNYMEGFNSFLSFPPPTSAPL